MAATCGAAGAGSVASTALDLDGANSAEVNEDDDDEAGVDPRTRQRAACGKRGARHAASRKGDDAAFEVDSLDSASRSRCRQEQQGGMNDLQHGDPLVAHVIIQHRLILPAMAQSDGDGDFEGGGDAREEEKDYVNLLCEVVVAELPDILNGDYDETVQYK